MCIELRGHEAGCHADKWRVDVQQRCRGNINCKDKQAGVAVRVPAGNRFSPKDPNKDTHSRGKSVKRTNEEWHGALRSKQLQGAVSTPRTEGTRPEEWR